jgi:hypothetical protein
MRRVHKELDLNIGVSELTGEALNDWTDHCYKRAKPKHKNPLTGYIVLYYYVNGIWQDLNPGQYVLYPTKEEAINAAIEKIKLIGSRIKENAKHYEFSHPITHYVNSIEQYGGACITFVQKNFEGNDDIKPESEELPSPFMFRIIEVISKEEDIRLNIH